MSDKPAAPERKSGSVPSILLSSSPHYVSPVNSMMLMRNVLFALAPVSVYGVIIFGLPALLNIVVGVASAILGESLFRLIIKQPVRAKDLSAGVSGLLLALIVPPSTPLWMTALGAIFAVVVVKEFFGGLGANIFNPALAGRAFLLMSFPISITRWTAPTKTFVADAVTGPSPLGIIRGGGDIAAVGQSFVDSGLSLDGSYWSTMRTLFFGNHAGSTGETSIFLILCGFVFLLVSKTIDWRIPVSMIVASSLAAFALELDPLFCILSGGFLFGAVFMATDYVTSPVTTKGKFIFGIGAGIIAVLIRKWGIYPEGVSYGILIMNAVTPFLNKLLPKKYGYVQKKKPAKKEGQ